MNLSVDKPVMFENSDTDVIDIDNAEFEVDEKGNLIVTRKSTGLQVGYFPATKWDCVYIRED